MRDPKMFRNAFRLMPSSGRFDDALRLMPSSGSTDDAVEEKNRIDEGENIRSDHEGDPMILTGRFCRAGDKTIEKI